MSRDALVVGINNYRDSNLPTLNAPASDAEAIALLLEKYGDFHVWRLPEAIDPNTRKPFIAKTQELSLTNLEEALVKLFNPEGRQIPDTALFYFSGHGLRKNRGIQEGFLASSDVDTNLGFNGLSLQWLRRLLQESPIKQQIIWLDCCHSGELLNFNEADPGEQGQARDRCFIAASREFEASYEDLHSDYSVLTKVLLEGLNPERCPRQWITNYSLIESIDRDLKHENQRPVFTNFGSPINLTRTLDTVTPVSKGRDSDDICPYKGLEYFDCNNEDPQYFYGREKLTDKLLDRVRQNNFLAILGASGSGKSSVLRAGLLHQLKLGRKLSGSQDWKIQIMLPGENPRQNLALSWLDANLSDTERATQLSNIKSLLEKGSEGLQTLVQASKANRVILVIDQFEESFTLCQDVAAREAFFQCLLAALEQTDNKLCLILAMRIDFFGKCFEREYSGLGNKIQAKDNFIAIPPMKPEELEWAIIKPAQKVNLSLETGLAETILKDIADSPGSLPLLQDTLTELWKRRTNNRLNFTAYAQLGGIGGTLNQRATQVYNSLSPLEKDTARHIFLCLTQLGEGTEDTRRRVLKRDLVTAQHDEQLIDNVVQKLADEKLIVTRNKIEPNSAIGSQVEIDVAHEALIRKWLLLRQWLEESRDKLRQKRKIEDAAREWQNSGRKTDYLLSKKRLREARVFQKEQAEKYPLSELAVSFVATSQKQQKRETVKFLGLFLIFPFIGTVIGGYFVVRELLLNADKTLIQNCEGKEYCARRVEALQNLVKAKKSLESYNLSGVDLSNVDFHSANLFGAKLSGAKLSGVNLINANLINANLINADLSEAHLSGSKLYNADLSEAHLFDANLSNADFSGGLSLYSANLSGADLSKAQLYDANLSDANLSDANLSKAQLYGANLSKALLYDADFSEAQLYGANLSGAKLNGVKNLTSSQIKSSCNWEKAIYEGLYHEDKLGWTFDEKANREYIEKLKQDKASDPKEPIVCSKWE